MPSPIDNPALSPAGPGPRAGRVKRGLNPGGWLVGVLSQSPQRPIALALAAAAAGLIVAMAALLHPVQHALTAVPPGDIALVNQEPILMSDFIMQTEQTTSKSFAATTRAERAAVLKIMINEELRVQRSLAVDMPEQDVDLRAALIDSLNSQTKSGVDAQTPSDEELQAYFNANRPKYISAGSMTLSDLVLHVGGFENTAQSIEQALADAKQAVYELRSGASVDYVKQHFALMDSGKVSGLQPDFAAKIHLGPKLYAAADQMRDGEISEPVADADGVHILIMEHRKLPLVFNFDSVRNNVFNDFQTARTAKATEDQLKFLRSTAQILTLPGQGE
jgi:parvulin-like peptidyl-prolyl isomerase